MARNKNIEAITKIVEAMTNANCGPTNGLSIRSLEDLTGMNYHALYRIVTNESNGFLKASNVDDYNSACYYHDIIKMAEILSTDTSNRAARIISKVDPYLLDNNEKKTEKLIFDLSAILHMLDRDAVYARRINFHLEKGAAKKAEAKNYYDWLFRGNTEALDWFTKTYKAKSVTDQLGEDFIAKLNEDSLKSYSEDLIKELHSMENATAANYIAVGVRLAFMGITVAHRNYLALGGDKDTE